MASVIAGPVDRAVVRTGFARALDQHAAQAQTAQDAAVSERSDRPELVDPAANELAIPELTGPAKPGVQPDALRGAQKGTPSSRSRTNVDPASLLISQALVLPLLNLPAIPGTTYSVDGKAASANTPELQLTRAQAAGSLQSLVANTPDLGTESGRPAGRPQIGQTPAPLDTVAATTVSAPTAAADDSVVAPTAVAAADGLSFALQAGRRDEDRSGSTGSQSGQQQQWSSPAPATSAVNLDVATVDWQADTQPRRAAGASQNHLELAQVLGDRLQVQLSRGNEHAVIRLDPPMKGSIEIMVRHVEGTVQVHLRASDADVARQLRDIGDTLKQDLVQRQPGQVSVHVSDGSRDQDGRGRQRQASQEQDQPGRAWEQSEESLEALQFGLQATNSEAAV